MAVAVRPPASGSTVGPAIGAFARGHPVLSYYVLTFALSWGGLLLVGGRGLFAGTDWQTDPTFLPAILAMISGPSVAGLLLTGLLAGHAGFRELLARLLRWRVGARWYAVALLTTPLVMAVVLFALSRGSPDHLPAIVTTDDLASLLLVGIAPAPLLALMEELGWTGFAIPRLRLRRGVLATGLIVGVLWGPWHLLQIVWVSRTMADGLPLALYLPLAFLAPTLLAYRVLMVWVYDRTGSLLVATLMHASYIASTLFLFATPATGAAFLTFTWVFAAALCALAAAVTVTTKGRPVAATSSVEDD
jgi:membrane protease YdiL (CAAX protease family)